MSKYAILVNSCDKYNDAWPAFFHILSKTWGTNLPPIYLNTEKSVCDVACAEVITLNEIKPGTWGERLKGALKRIESEYVLMMLEDFYYESPIKVGTIDKCVEAMENDRNILSFQMVPASEVYRGEVKNANEEFEGFALRDRKGTYTFIAGPTLWRKNDLIKLTKSTDTPWTWEWYGSFRTWLYGKRIYCWKSFDNPIFDYDIAHGGAIHGGKWVGYKVKELEEQYHISIDTSKRGVEEDWIKRSDSQPKRVISKSICRKIVGLGNVAIKYIQNNSVILSNVLYGLLMRFSPF